MMGEVLSVIRALAGEGITMMIVTHEMKFARDVSSCIFGAAPWMVCQYSHRFQNGNNQMNLHL